MSADLRRAARALAAAGAIASLGACSWFTDFKEQPKHDPWESPSDTIPMRGNPQNSVSVYGSAAPGFAVSRERLPGTVDSMRAIPNPVPADERSLANGRKYYNINCAVCHGVQGNADGPATKYGFPGIGIGKGSNAATTLPDGYIWGMIRNGRGLMPSYNRIEELDRWDVVNYLRGLQGRYPVAVGPVGLPGETGDKVPGYSEMGPTRPSPWYHRAGSQAGPGRGMNDTPGAAGSTSPAANQPGGNQAGVAPPSAQQPEPAATIPPTTTPKTGGER